MDEYPQLKKAFAYVISGSIRRAEDNNKTSLNADPYQTHQEIHGTDTKTRHQHLQLERIPKRRDPNVLHKYHLDVYEYIMNYYINEYCREIDNPPWESSSRRN